MTVYRRYLELYNNIKLIHNLKKEFKEEPDIIVVWAQPEVGRLWFFQKMIKDKMITNVVSRLKLENESENHSSTYPESHNIRVGLNYIKSNYDNNKSYVVMQAADIKPNEKMAYQFIDLKMNDGDKAVLFHWQNGCAHHNIWHTNFFAVALDEKYWPPLSEFGDADVLESKWGKELANKNLPGICESHNSNNKKFLHIHESENNPEIFIYPQNDNVNINLFIKGHLNWFKRIWCKILQIKQFLSRRGLYGKN